MKSLAASTRPRISLRATGITKLFGETVALWDVDLDAQSAALIAIRGANGSGKSTLLRVLAGVATPTRGRIAWTTTDPGSRPRVALVGHATHLFDELTALENVELAARLARRDRAVAVELLGELGVGRDGARRAGGLSAGTRRRVALARALATDPDVLLVDEPFAGLDEASADLVGRVLARSREAGRLLVVATHDDARSRSIATRTLWLVEGRMGSEPDHAAAAPA